MNRAGKIALTVAASAAVSLGAIPLYEWATGTSVIVRFGGTVWVPVGENTPFLSKGIAAALRKPVPEARPGAYEWRTVQRGFDVAELPVIAAGAEVDRILLARIDPARFRFAIRNDPSGSKSLGGWMKTLDDAVLVVNGSYYASSGLPATPTIMEGSPFGPGEYDARHGAFIAGKDSARLVDVAQADWKKLFSGVRHAVVSYPLLLARDGSSRVPKPSSWLANRSFLAEDTEGRIIVGTTKDGFFTLSRLAAFLGTVPLDLKIALNLDGGPVACQAIRLGSFRRRSCGQWEIRVDHNGRAKMLPPVWWVIDPPMPLVMAVYAEE